MKTRSSNILLSLFLVPLLFLICGIPCIVQANEWRVPVSETFNWDPAPPDLTPDCGLPGGGSFRQHDFKHIFKASKFNPNMGDLRRVDVRFHSTLLSQLHSSTNLGSDYRIESLVSIYHFYNDLGDPTTGAYFRFSTPHLQVLHDIPIEQTWTNSAHFENLYNKPGYMGFALNYQDFTYRNDSVTVRRYATDVSDYYSYSDPTYLEDFIGNGTFDIEFGSRASWYSYVGYYEYNKYCGNLCYYLYLMSDCPTELTASASLQWTVLADVTYIYDPFYVYGHSPARAEANGPYFGVVGTPIWFTAGGSIGYPEELGVVLFEWHWGDDTVTTTTAADVQHVYSQPYQGQVELIITDGEGATKSAWASVTVTSPWIPGDLDHDGDVDFTDISIIQSYRNKSATTCPSCDLDGDGMITVLDVRKAVLLCTRPRCTTQ